MPRGRKREEWRQKPKIESHKRLQFPNLLWSALKDSEFKELKLNVAIRLFSFISQTPAILGELLNKPATQENLTQARKRILAFALKNNVQKALVHSEKLQTSYMKKGMNLQTAIVVRLRLELQKLATEKFDAITADPSLSLEQYLTTNDASLMKLIQVWD